MPKTRKQYSPAQKIAILRRHLIDKVPVSDLCDEHQIQPTVFYNWQKQLFERGEAAFARAGNGRRAQDAPARRIAELEDKLQRKNEVVAELMEEHVQLKKKAGAI